jgi:hypothetical protein
MDSSSANVGQKSLDEFVDVVAKIYSSHDKHRSVWDVWCHTLHHAASVAEQIRKGAPHHGDLYREIADFSLWLFTTILKLVGKFGDPKGSFEAPHDKFIRIQSTCSDLLWYKYPKSCPSCSGSLIADARPDDVGLGHIKRCNCPVRPPEAEDAVGKRMRIGALRKYSTMIHAEKPKSIDEWQGMFGEIFGGNLATLTLSDIALHLMEELGEASNAMIRMYSYKEETFRSGEPNWRQRNLEAQLADVFSWLFALVVKLDLLRHDPGQYRELATVSAFTPTGPIRLSGIIWMRYGSDEMGSFYCPFCKKVVCKCPIVLVPGTRLIEDLVRNFQ